MLRGRPSVPLWRRLARLSADPLRRLPGATPHHCCRSLHLCSTAPFSHTPAHHARAPSPSATSAADNLLSQWGRRSQPGTQRGTAATTAATASPSPAPSAAPYKDPLSRDDFSVEELLVFDEDDGPCGLSSQDSNATPRSKDQVVSGNSLPFSKAKQMATSAAADDVGETEDVDAFGMAASAAQQERDLMADLLRQAALDSAVTENEEEEPDQPNSSLFRSALEQDDDTAALSGSVAAAPRLVGTRESNENALAALGGTVPSAETDEDDAGEEAKGAVYDAADGDGEEEDSSMDTVLEEETERMLQAALANMVKESADRTATATTAAGGASAATRSRTVGGRDGYVFFTKEAVMAAAESLAAAETATAAARAAGTAQSGGASGEFAGGIADFDDDMVRAVEVETLGLDVETRRQ